MKILSTNQHSSLRFTASWFLAALLTAGIQPLYGQTPGKGFDSKRKARPAQPGLAEILHAGQVPVPQQRPGRQTLAATGTSPMSVQPLRLRVVRDSATGLPVYIENRNAVKASTNGAGRRALTPAAAQATTFQFLNQVKGLLRINRAEESFTLKQTLTDELGQTHVRLTQTFQGIPVYGGELVAHLSDQTVELVNGRYQTIPAGTATKPELTAVQAGDFALRDVRKHSLVRSFGDNFLKLKPSEGELMLYPLDGGAVLAYSVTVRPNLLERWQYLIDAQTGAVIEKYNHTCGVDGPVKATAKDLNGTTRTLQTFLQGTKYYMIDATRSMYNGQTSKLPDSPVGALWTIDAQNTFGDNTKMYQLTSANNTNWTPTAVSAHYNSGIAFDYYQKTFNRNSLNGKGGTIISVINLADDDGKGLDNAYWNGAFMGYGNGQLGFKPLAGGLDVAGHEMTHGVIENTANLEYKSQSGALNESFADIFGVMIDRDDWTIGEDVVQTAYFKSGALRSMSNPNQGGKGTRGYQPKTMGQYESLPVTEDGDNGGVHVNSGIPNYAFYLFATNNSVGRDKAEKVYYRALTTYLTRTSKFLDLRLAVIKATGDLYGATGAEVTAAKAAFDAVGIVESTTTTPTTKPDAPVAQGQDLLLLYGSDSKLYSTTVVTSGSKFDLKTAQGLRHRPSVTDNGQFAYFVSADKRIRAVSLTGTPTESMIQNEPRWSNVAISRDGTKLAALSDEQDASIWVYSFTKKQWKQFKLYNPTYSEGVATGAVRYADSFEWDHAGEYIIYDGYNALNSADGQPIDYWDVGFLRAWDGAKNDFGDGAVEKLFNDLEEGESVGNPSYSKNSPDIVSFDYFYSDGSSEQYYVLAADLNKGSLKLIYENNTLGFPSYSRLDNRLVFNVLGPNDRGDVGGINLAADKITPSGSLLNLYNNAKWPVWYTQATRTIPTRTNQSITFNTLSNRYASDPAFTLAATASSGLPVSFAIVSGPAEITGNKVSVTGPGTVTVRAYQEGNGEFYAATPVERSFTVMTILGLEPTWQEAVKLYPNPSKSDVWVEVPAGHTIEQVTLTSLSGSVLRHEKPATRSTTAHLSMATLPSGVYILTVETPKGNVIRKLMKD
nr:M4 family metallopeptidase [uncultured Arsenicibacter sp.]